MFFILSFRLDLTLSILNGNEIPSPSFSIFSLKSLTALMATFAFLSTPFLIPSGIHWDIWANFLDGDLIPNESLKSFNILLPYDFILSQRDGAFAFVPFNTPSSVFIPAW